MNHETKVFRCNLKAINSRRLSLSGWFLVLSFFVIQFDSYLGSQNLSFITIGILVLFMIARSIEGIIQRIPIKLKLNIVLVYLVYNVFLTLSAYSKIGLTYNNLLFLSMLCFFVVFACWPANTKEIQSMATASVFQMLLFIIICLRYAVISGGDIYMGIRDIIDPNYLVTNSILMIGFFLYKIQLTKKTSGFYTAILVCILFAYIICVALIGSRGGLLTMGVALVMFLLLQSRKPLRAICVLVILGIIGLIVFFNFMPAYITERFTIEHMLQDGGSGRLTIWSNYLSYYSEQGIDFWLFGAGRDVPPTQIYLIEFGRGYYSHNLFVKALMEGGFIGLLLLLGSILYLLKRGIKFKNGLFIAVIAAFIIGAMFLDLDNMRFFYLILAFGVSVNKNMPHAWKGKIVLQNKRK